MTLKLQPAAAGPMAVGDRTGPLIKRGAELVHLCEQMHVGMFTLALALLGAAGIFSVPLAQANPLERGHPLTLPFSSLATLATISAFRRRRNVYLWLRRNRFRQVLPGLAAAMLVLADGPYSPCWWIATALLLTVTTVSTAGPTLIAGAITAAAYAAGTLLHSKSLLPAGDTEYLTVTASLFANPLIARAVIESFARFVLRLHKLEREAIEARQPIRVRAIVPSDEIARAFATPPETTRGAVMTDQIAGATATRAGTSDTRSVTSGQAEPSNAPTPYDSSARRQAAFRLTARQLEVILLARDGLHQPEIAGCLGISPRQVERHLEQARRRTGALTTAHLVAMLVSERLTPATDGDR